MFDWNDQELTDIIWDEAVEGEDHTVPYPDRVELKKPNIKSELRDELIKSSRYETRDSGAGLVLNSSLSSSNNMSRSCSLRDDTTQFDKDSELFQSQLDGGGEQGDFINCDWANIGSFDDLDRIFSKNEPIFRDVSGVKIDELWPSSKDITSSPLSPLSGDSSGMSLGALRTSRLNEITSCTPKNVLASIDTTGDSGGKSKLLVKEKVLETSGKNKGCANQLDNLIAVTHNEFLDKGKEQKIILKGAEREVRQPNDLCGISSISGSSFPQVSSQYSLSMVKQYPSFGISQERQLCRGETLQLKHFPGPVLASSLSENMINYNSTPLAKFHPDEGNCELVSSGYEVPHGSANSLKKSVDAVKPPAMTPKEKIEKLRRRQQMRAILAIKKLQQQFGNQVPVTEYPSMEGGSLEVDERLNSFLWGKANSPLELDDSKTMSRVFNNCSVEESVLYQLQDTIAKLDSHIRLCIRDSLFRLAESALQRQYPGETKNTNTNSRDEVTGNMDINNHDSRVSNMANVEVDTNPIDRTVAHLLFHRPLQTPQLPVSTNLPCDTKGDSLTTLTDGCFTENHQMTTSIPVIYSKDGSKRPRLDTPNNVSNNENADGILKASK